MKPSHLPLASWLLLVTLALAACEADPDPVDASADNAQGPDGLVDPVADATDAADAPLDPAADALPDAATPADAVPDDATADADPDTDLPVDPTPGLSPWPECPTCPVPIIEGVPEGLMVPPQTVLKLSAAKSQPSGGHKVVKFLWSSSQPKGSGKPFEPDPAEPEVLFRPDVVGDYQVCLTCWNDLGQQAYKTKCSKFSVFPDSQIHVELLWDTPADPDQFDQGVAAGADVDLHFAGPQAVMPDLDCDGVPDPWFSNPNDTFWFNPHPSWGPAVENDPALDLDDTDGAGPENLNVVAPLGTLQDPVAYSLGIHYWNDHGWGVSNATVSIFSMGVLVMKIEAVQLFAGNMWYVGKLNWPSTLQGVNLPAVTLCKQSGDACLAKTQPQNPLAGQMWQASGDWCITPCYENKSFISGTTSTSAFCD